MTSTEILSRIVAIASPDHDGSFWDDYIALLYETVKTAIYRIVQGVCAISPIALGFWICGIIEYPWIYMTVTTATTTGLGIRNLINPSQPADVHAVKSK